MTKSQLPILSAEVLDLARRLAGCERRSVTEIVERAVDTYEVREAGREPAAVFYSRLTRSFGSTIDLDAVVREGRRAYP